MHCQHGIGAKRMSSGTMQSRLNACERYLITLYETFFVASINKKCKSLSEAESNLVNSGMRYFSLLLFRTATIGRRDLLDSLCGQLENCLSFQLEKGDLAMLQHKLVVECEYGTIISGARCRAVRTCFSSFVLSTLDAIILRD